MPRLSDVLTRITMDNSKKDSAQKRILFAKRFENVPKIRKEWDKAKKQSTVAAC